MRKLTAQEIEQLASLPDVNRQMVEDWLTAMCERIDPLQALIFLRHKAEEGGYDRATVEGIRVASSWLCRTGRR